jgi:hypothetical protein
MIISFYVVITWNSDSSEQHRFAVAHSLAVQMVFDIRIEDFITYPWTPINQILEFIWIFESQKTKTMSKIPKTSEKMQNNVEFWSYTLFQLKCYFIFI